MLLHDLLQGDGEHRYCDRVAHQTLENSKMMALFEQKISIGFDIHCCKCISEYLYCVDPLYIESEFLDSIVFYVGVAIDTRI